MRIPLIATLMFVCAASTPSFADDVALIRKGAKIYDNNCSTCHGDDLQNNSSIAFDLRRFKASEHERFVSSLLHGKGAMPGWQGQLDMDQIEALWAYVRANAFEK